MKRFAALLFASSACTVGPKLVSVPMATSAPIGPLTTLPGVEAPDDVETAMPEELTGTWTGRAYQTGNKSWPVTVTFEKRGSDLVGHAQYQDQRCRADWTLRSPEPHRWSGEEDVKIDPFSRCPNHARITIEVSEDEMTWRWIGSGGTAQATLTRTQP